MVFPSRKMRILCLPGYLQNAGIMRARMRPICDLLAPHVDFVVVEPPHILQTPTPTSNSSQPDDTSGFHLSPSQEPRAWWFATIEREMSTQFRLLDETLLYLRSILETQGPFDGIFAFSQGAACATMLATLIENPRLHPIFAKGADGLGEGVNWPPKQFKFAVLASGYLPLDERVVPWYKEVGKLRIPSLHVMGTGDTIIANETSLTMMDHWANPRIEWHLGGHYVPNKPSWRSLFKTYIESFLDDAPQSQEPGEIIDVDKWLRGERPVYGSRTGKGSLPLAMNLRAKF